MSDLDSHEPESIDPGDDHFDLIAKDMQEIRTTLLTIDSSLKDFVSLLTTGKQDRDRLMASTLEIVASQQRIERMLTLMERRRMPRRPI